MGLQVTEIRDTPDKTEKEQGKGTKQEKAHAPRCFLRISPRVLGMNTMSTA